MHLGHVRLRGHHLVCTHFFDGADFEAEFTHHLGRIMAEFESRGIVVESGPDDLCVHCLRLDENGDCTFEEAGESSIRGMDALALTLLDVRPKDHVTFSTVVKRLPDVLPRWQQFACGDCRLVSTCRNRQDLLARGA